MAKFFRFSLKGDNLDPDKINDLLDLPCTVYHKNDIVIKEINGKEHFLKQKTNRLVYSTECSDNKRTDGFLSENLEIVYSIMKKVRLYLNSDSLDIVIELIIYTDKKARICINKHQADLISKIGARIDIVFP